MQIFAPTGFSQWIFALRSAKIHESSPVRAHEVRKSIESLIFLKHQLLNGSSHFLVLHELCSMDFIHKWVSNLLNKAHGSTKSEKSIEQNQKFRQKNDEFSRQSRRRASSSVVVSVVEFVNDEIFDVEKNRLESRCVHEFLADFRQKIRDRKGLWSTTHCGTQFSS